MIVRLQMADSRELLRNALRIAAAQCVDRELPKLATGDPKGLKKLTKNTQHLVGRGASLVAIVVPKITWPRGQRDRDEKVIGMTTCDDPTMAAAMVSAAARSYGM